MYIYIQTYTHTHTHTYRSHRRAALTFCVPVVDEGGKHEDGTQIVDFHGPASPGRAEPGL